MWQKSKIISHRVESPDFAYNDQALALEPSPQHKKQLKSKFSPYVHNDKSFKKSVLPLTINSKFEQRKQNVVEKKPQDSPKGIHVSENEVQ